MIKKLTALLLCIAVVLSAGASVFAMERSIQPLNDTGSIDNAGRSMELVYEGENARVYYGSSGISIVSESGTKHLGTNFAVKKLLVLGDVNGDGCPDFLTCQSAPEYSAQVMTISGRDGKVLADLHLTHKGYDDNLGPVDENSFVQQFLSTADGNALIVYDYSIIKVDAETLEILWTHSSSDNIWKAISAGDPDGDGSEDFAYTMQQNTVALINGADGSLTREWHPCEDREIEITWAKKTITAVMNMWDLALINGMIYATSEDGLLFSMDPLNGEVAGICDIGAIDPSFLDDLLTGYNLEYDYATPVFRSTGINNWPYMGYRIADTDGEYILIDCYLGDADSCAQYQDSSWQRYTALYGIDSCTIEALIPISGYEVPYQKNCLTFYGDTPCIAVASNCYDKHASVNYYDYTGALIYQKEIESAFIGNSPRFEMSAAEDGLRMEFFDAGCIIVSQDLKTVSYAYDKTGIVLEKAPDGSYFVFYSTNGSKDRIQKFEKSLAAPVWEYRLNAEYPNDGIKFARADRDYDGDGINDVMAIVDSMDEDGQADASWFMILSGADGSEVCNFKVKTGEGIVDKKKVEYFLISDTVDTVRDLDGDKKPELICGDSIVSSKRRTVIGYLYGGVDAEGRSFQVGDTNADGLPDFLVVSDKETRLYESKLGMSYGFASVEYKKTGTYMLNSKDLEPVNTSELIGDIDGDGIKEIVLIGKNVQGFQTYKVYNGKTLEYFYDLCPEGITSDMESFISLEYDINGDGWNEIFARNFNWEYCIHDGKTGEELVNLSTVGRDEEEGGVIIYYGAGGKGDYHPDYLVPFYPLEDKPNFIITSDADGDGLGDITQIQGYWDYDTFKYMQKLVIIGSSDFRMTSEVKLGGTDEYYNGELLKVDGSDRYAAVMNQNSLSLLDLSEQKLMATYNISANKAMQIDKDIVVTTPLGDLLKLNIDRSFDLSAEVPEESADSVLELAWEPAQDYSIMTISDNGTVVYSGSDTSAKIPLVQGEHDITLSMNDGQGKTYSETHHVNVAEQKSFPVVPTVLACVLLIACLFFGILRRSRIAARFKEAAK